MMTVQRARLGFAALIAVLGLAFAAPASAEIVLHRGNNSEPDTLDPQKASGVWENNIIGDMFLGLMTEDTAAHVIPGAAESYAVSPDGLVYTFKLREGIVWSDGVPMTADDVVFSYRRIADPNTAAQYAVNTYVIKNAQAVNENKMPKEQVGVRAIDERTVEITLEHPAPYFPQLLTHFALFIVPKHVVETYGDDWVKPGTMVVNGAYSLAEWIPNEYVKAVKNARFYDAENVKIDTVYYYPVSDAQAALKRFRSGEFDLNNNLPLQQVQWLRENMPAEVQMSPTIWSNYVIFNTTRAPYDDLNVRNALGLAIDRELITGRILAAGQVPAYALVPIGMENYPGAAQVNYRDRPLEQRRAKARELLAAAGYGPDNPLKFNFIFNSGVDNKRIAVALQDMWRQIGVEITVQQIETKVHYNTLRKQDFEVAWSGWVADFNDARNYLSLFESTTPDMNYGKYANAQYDALVRQSDTILDVAERAKIMAEAEQIMLDEAAIAPVYFATSRNLVHTYVKGWVENALDIHRTRFLSIEGREIAAADPARGAGGSGAVAIEEKGWLENLWSWFLGLLCGWFGIACQTA